MTREFLGISGAVAGYEVAITGDRVLVFSDGKCVRDHVADGLGRFVRKPGRTIRLGWARTADYEIVHVYDKRDGFGYALNLTVPDLSEWGYVCPGEATKRERPRARSSNEEEEQEVMR